MSSYIYLYFFCVHYFAILQEKDQVTARLERHRAEAEGLERQVVAIGEEVRRKDEAQRRELLACQEALQQVSVTISLV